MPSRNSLKEYVPQAYYHVYNRGVDKQPVFRDEQDYKFFIKLLRRYLDTNYKAPEGEVLRPSFAPVIELLAYCLMPNHFHILLYQLDDEKALERLFRSIMTAYAMYFNSKYKRVGPLFQGRYKASRINSDQYLHHISRYIHLNPIDIQGAYTSYPYSSYLYYQGSSAQGFVKSGRILELFEGNDYVQFVAGYAEAFRVRPKGESDMIPGLS